MQLYYYATAFLIGIAIFLKKMILKIEYKMLFVPTVTAKEREYPLQDLKQKFTEKYDSNIKLEEVTIVDPKNQKQLSGIWYQHPKKSKVILYAHGNAGCIGTRFPFLQAFAGTASILLFDYRGYGKSDGLPSEIVLYEDISTAYYYLINHFGYKSSDIVIYGESLGCVPTAWLANRLKDTIDRPGAIILQCGFSNLKNIGRDIVGFFVMPLISTELNNVEQVAQIGSKIPIMIAHSRNDELIHFYHSELLQKANPHAIHYELYGSHSGPENFTDKYVNKIKQMFLD
jgi:uncharacterized protein